MPATPSDSAQAPSPDPRLQALLDRAAIEELVLSYARAVDRRDFAALRDLYHPDATDDHAGYYKGPAAGFIDWLEEGMAETGITQHYVCNMLIRLAEGGARAEGEIYALNYHRMNGPGGPADFIAGGRYLDVYEKRADGIWRFASRTVAPDWSRMVPAAGTPADPALAERVRPADPSYALLRLLDGPRGAV